MKSRPGLAGRGKLFACQHEDVRPDVVIIGKALSRWFFTPYQLFWQTNPSSACLKPVNTVPPLVEAHWLPAVARASLKVIVDEKLIDNAATLGEYFMDQLAEINSPHVKEVRGKGMLIGVELKT